MMNRQNTSEGTLSHDNLGRDTGRLAHGRRVQTDGYADLMTVPLPPRLRNLSTYADDALGGGDAAVRGRSP
jgi:hypothetical protein